MKKCKAIKKNGSECDANGIHIVPVIGKGDVVYATVLPPDHVDSTWASSSINVCGAHRKMLMGGAAINVAPVIAPTYGCACRGTGVDPDFGDPCKCSSAMSPSPSQDFIPPVTPAQEKYINDLMTTIKSTMRLELDWANVQTKKEAMEVIDLLKTTKSFVNLLKIKKDKLTPEQMENIRAKINAKPTKAWLVASLKKLSSL